MAIWIAGYPIGELPATGFMPVGVKSRAVNGHEFGLKLKPEDRAALIVFLKTL